MHPELALLAALLVGLLTYRGVLLVVIDSQGVNHFLFIKAHFHQCDGSLQRQQVRFVSVLETRSGRVEVTRKIIHKYCNETVCGKHIYRVLKMFHPQSCTVGCRQHTVYVGCRHMKD